jgi:membrane complex biogenesis BtpA family protein
VFERRENPSLVGVIHLLPIPGSPSAAPKGAFESLRNQAVADAITFRDAGVDGVIIENFGDAPFERAEVSPHTIAIMTRLALELREILCEQSVGINVLRNDAHAALGIATACEADFIRVNVFTGTVATDQGIIEGAARALHLERNRLQSSVKFAADIHVKHGTPLHVEPIEEAASDTINRGKADAVILTGSGTGKITSTQDLTRVREALPRSPLWVGSGVTANQIAQLQGVADALIVGSWFRGSSLKAPVQPDRVKELVRLLAIL